VVVTRTNAGRGIIADYATIAYNAITGAQQWARRYNGPVSRDDRASCVAVYPGGTRIFVKGESVGAVTPGKASGFDYETVAHSG
jgi:hypothetical protein